MKTKTILALTLLLSCGSPSKITEVPEVATIGIASCDAYLREAALCVPDKEGSEQDALLKNIREKEVVWLRIAEKGPEAQAMLSENCESSLLYFADNWKCN